MMAGMGISAQEWGTLGMPDDGGLARLWHVAETDLATLRHVFYEPGATVAGHRHDRPSLVYGVGGPCVELSNASKVVRRRLTFLPEDHEHRLEYKGPTHVLAIEIEPDWFRKTCEDRFKAELTPLPATLYDLVWNVLLDIAGHAAPERISASLRGLVEAAVDYVRKPPSPLVAALIDELHQHPKDVPSVTQLARKYSRSRQYICRVFKERMGVTLQQYGLLVRLDYARGLLWGSKLSIADVAMEAGFADQSHLTRALAAHSAWTPLRMRWVAPCTQSSLPAAIRPSPSGPAVSWLIEA